MQEVRARRRQAGTAGKRQDERSPDDWLGDISDDDWDDPAAQASDRPATPARQERRASEELGSTSQAPAATAARRTAVERRRGIAAIIALLLVVLGAGAALLLLRDGGESSATTVPESSTVTTPADTETDPLTTTPSTTPTTTTPTTPSENVATFTLPAGTKLQRGESIGESDLTVSTDPELIRELQRALAAAGFDPGSVDGVFGESTEAAVVAFQQANGLTLDGIVGPETAEALNSAISGG